jgi:hypothetical protein
VLVPGIGELDRECPTLACAQADGCIAMSWMRSIIVAVNGAGRGLGNPRYELILRYAVRAAEKLTSNWNEEPVPLIMNRASICRIAAGVVDRASRWTTISPERQIGFVTVVMLIDRRRDVPGDGAL